jgi:hypothetical protein
MAESPYGDQVRRLIREIQRANLQALASEVALRARQIRELQESAVGVELKRTLAAFQQATVPRMPDIARVVDTINSERAREIAAVLTEIGKSARELQKRALPPNWLEFNSDEIEAIIALMEETGWSLVWVPRADIVRKLLDAADEEPQDVLLASKDEILDDLNAALLEVKHSQLVELRDHIVQAIGSFRAGFDAPAQALASAVFTTLMHVHLGLRKFGEAREEFAKHDPIESDIMLLKLAAIYRTAARAIDTYWGEDDESIPTDFNRHASTHRVSEVQYTTVNALAALLLVTSLLRELEPLFHLQFPERPR